MMFNASADVIFQADFKGSGIGTGGDNDLVTLGGTGSLYQHTTAATTVQSEPTMGQDSYVKVTAGQYPSNGNLGGVAFKPASAGNSFAAFSTVGNGAVALDGGGDFFLRINNPGAAGFGVSNWFRFTVDGHHATSSPGGLTFRLHAQSDGGWHAIRIEMEGGPGAFYAFDASSGGYTEATHVVRYSSEHVNWQTGVVYHFAYTFSTDEEGISTLGLYLREGEGGIDTTSGGHRLGSVSFKINAAVVTSGFPSGEFDFGFAGTSGGQGAENPEGSTATGRDIDADRFRLYDAVPVFMSGIAEPVIFNTSRSARAGDIVPVQGQDFGFAAEVWLEGEGEGRRLDVVNRVDDTWLAVQIPASARGALVIRVHDGDGGISAPVALNAAIPLHLDATQIVPGGAFRLFGRNLLLPGSTPVVTVNGLEAPLDIHASNEHMLVLAAPQGISAGPDCVITVDNGNGTGSAILDRIIRVLAVEPVDAFGLGVGWAGAFDFAHNVIQANVAADGVSNDGPAVQAAVNQAAGGGGGLVRLPAGTLRFQTNVSLPSRVVLQGAGKEATLIISETDYPLYVRNRDLVGVCDLSIINSETVPAKEAVLMQSNSNVFLKNILINSWNCKNMFLGDNKNMVVTGCDFIHRLGYENAGAYHFMFSSGLVFTGNTTEWVDASPSFGHINDGFISQNRFLRNAISEHEEEPVTNHSLVLGGAHRVTITDNLFDVINGPLTRKDRNDGEAILAEPFGAATAESVGFVRSAGADTLYDPDNSLDTDPFGTGIPENYGVAIVGGKGTGQSRRIVGYANSTITVDRPWDVIPDSTSRYATSVWGLEKTLIKDNTLIGNPRGLWLYQVAIREIDIIGNHFEEGGGIYLRTWQALPYRQFTSIHNVKIQGNTVVNTTGNWPSYIAVVSVSIDGAAFGTSFIGIEVRDNELVANQPNLETPGEDYARQEGVVNWIKQETDEAYQETDTPRILGSIFQGNRISLCDVGFRLGTDAQGTVLAYNQVEQTATFWTDTRIRTNAPLSRDTVVLHGALAPELLTAVSRKTHGSAGVFDIALEATSSPPASALPPIECRRGSTLDILLTFDKPVASFNATIAEGIATIGSITCNAADSSATLHLTGAANAQALTISLNSITAEDGGVLADATVRLGVLHGDTTGDGKVNAADINQTRSRSGLTPDAVTFRSDITGDGKINTADANLAQNQSGLAIP